MTPVAVVTGAAQGIGAAICRTLRSEGWKVIGVDLQPAPAGEWRRADCSDEGELERALEDVSRLDGLVNNAALQHAKPLLETSGGEWDRVFAVNARGPFLATKLTARRLAATGGAIVNVASVHALATSENVGPYAASKAALLGLTRAAALELADRVRVNAVVPGAIDTPALQRGFARRVDTDPATSLVSRTPLGRIGTPEDVALAVSFLLDPVRAAFITGEAVTVDGGVLARLASE